jgi:hypothetical protein
MQRFFSALGEAADDPSVARVLISGLTVEAVSHCEKTPGHHRRRGRGRRGR